MKLIKSPTEQTTAITDLIMAAVAFIIGWYVAALGASDAWKANLWAFAFGLLTLAGILGSIAHGLQLQQRVLAWLWRLLFLTLGLLVAMFVVAAIRDTWGQPAATVALPIMVVIGLLFFGTTFIWPDTFLGFVIYEGVAMLFALGCYLWLAWQGDLPGAWWLVAGIAVTIVAAGIQASKAISFTFIWPFDHNGVYHLVQIIGLFLLGWGLHLGLGAG